MGSGCLFISGSSVYWKHIDYLYSIVCEKRIQEQGFGAWEIERDFRVGVFGNPPWPAFLKGGYNASML
jgi:hypothetical protein